MIAIRKKVLFYYFITVSIVIFHMCINREGTLSESEFLMNLLSVGILTFMPFSILFFKEAKIKTVPFGNVFKR